MVNLCKEQSRSRVCKHPFEFFKCRNIGIEYNNGKISHLIELKLFIPQNDLNAYEFSTIPFKVESREDKLIQFESEPLIYFGTERNNPKIVFSKCDNKGSKILCYFGSEMKVVNKCLNDLVQNETEPRCGISILETQCVLNKR